MRVEIARLHRDFGVTMISVTHDQLEAMTLANRVVVPRAGVVEQIGSPQELYDTPANTFVAGFIGSPKINFIVAQVAGASSGRIEVPHPSLPAPLVVAPRAGVAGPEPGDAVTLGLRPEHILFGDGSNRIELNTDLSESLGGSTLIHGQTATGETVNLQTAGRHALTKGAPIMAGFSATDAYLFDKAGQTI